MTRPRRAFIGLGSNLSDRLALLQSAKRSLSLLPDTQYIARSSLYRSSPIGEADQPFLNAAILLETTLCSRRLLDLLLAIEDQHGRVRTSRWGNRTLDLDLLCVLDQHNTHEIMEEQALVLPHPQLIFRDFVLLPLEELDPSLRIAGVSLRTHREALRPEQLTVQETLSTW